MKVGDLVVLKRLEHVKHTTSEQVSYMDTPAIVIDLWVNQISSVVEPQQWVKLYHSHGNIRISSMPAIALEVIGG